MGALSCCSKVILVVVNIIFLIIGISMFVAGILILTKPSFIQDPVDKAIEGIPNAVKGSNLQNSTDTSSAKLDVFEHLKSIGIGLLVSGLIIVAIGILGTCGACCEIKVMLIIYVVIVGIIFLISLILIILLFTGKMDKHFRGKLNDMLVNSYVGTDAVNPESLLWNVLMIQMKCCGLDGYKDFNNATKWDKVRTFKQGAVSVNITLTIPIACCKMSGKLPDITPVDKECAYKPTDTNANWKTGCWDATIIKLKKYKNTAIGVFTAMLVFEAILIILAIVIMSSGSSKVA